jgi:IPTL-CTERM motif
MVKKTISKWLIGAAALGFAAGTMAAPFSVKYTDTVSTPSVLGINNGQQATIELIVDNGNSSVASQTWSAANVKVVCFTFNNAQDLFVAINYSGSPVTSNTTGNFTTNGAGVLQTAPSNWADTSNPIVNPVVTNIAGSTPVQDWVINGINDVLFLNGGNSVGFTNVTNDTVAADWSNPVPANGVCAGFFAPAPARPPSAHPIPTLTTWGVVMLSSLLLLGVVFFLRRQRR